MLNLVLVLRTQARFSQMVEMLRVVPLILLGGDLLMMCMCSYHEEGLHMFLKGGPFFLGGGGRWKGVDKHSAWACDVVHRRRYHTWIFQGVLNG